MRKLFFIFASLLSVGIAQTQNVSIGHTIPLAKLDIRGIPANPSIPGVTSTGVLRVGVSNMFYNSGIDLGKMGVEPWSGWIQSGLNGFAVPLSLQPLGGNIAIGTTNPASSAILDVTSTSQGFLLPRMTLDQINNIPNPAQGLMVFCTNCAVQTGELQIYNGISWFRILLGQTTADTLAVGNNYGGGKIFYLFQSEDPGYILGEQHGLIMYPNANIDLEGWGCNGIDIPGAYDTAIGTGFQNTLDIVLGCPESTPAQYCNDLVIGTYSDWYLPSQDEFNKIYENRAYLYLAFSLYTTSSEIDATTVWNHSIDTGLPYAEFKNTLVAFHPIRSF